MKLSKADANFVVNTQRGLDIQIKDLMVEIVSGQRSRESVGEAVADLIVDILIDEETYDDAAERLEWYIERLQGVLRAINEA